MRKKALLALLLVLSLSLSGCALIQKDQSVDDATPIVTLGNDVIDKAEFSAKVNELLVLYSLYGYDVSDAKIVSEARNMVLDEFKNQLVMESKAREAGLDDLTEDEEKKIADEADEMVDLGYYPDRESALSESRLSLLTEKLRDHVSVDVTVSDDEIKTEYDRLAESDKTDFEANPASYCSDVNNGSTVYYIPAGVRMVKNLLIQYSDEKAQAIADAEDKVAEAQAVLDNENSTEEDKQKAQSDLEAAQAEVKAATEAAFASIDEEADAVLARLDEGEDWDTVMAEKTKDPGMQGDAATAKTGYAVCAEGTTFDTAFVDAAMALKAPGDYSGKVRSAASFKGYYIIKYVSDAVAGPVALDAVKDTISESLLYTNKTVKYTETMKEWVSAADFKVDLKALDQ